MNAYLLCNKHALDKTYRDPQGTYYVLHSICVIILTFTNIDNEIVIRSPVRLIYSMQQPDVCIWNARF
jgi:hypothetical protein